MIDASLQSIVHPTDFSDASLDAFVHALRLSIAARSLLHLLHIEHGDTESSWTEFPRVRKTLAAWGMMDASEPESAVAAKLGVRISKTKIRADDPARGIVSFLEKHRCDLMVLATHTRNGLQRWARGSVAEAAARSAGVPTLFLREGQNGFVDRQTGALSLKTILLPIDHSVPFATAGKRIETFAALVEPSARIHLLHVGLDAPRSDDGRALCVDLRQGPVVETILAVCEEIGAGVIAMPTAGRHGLFDALQGSTTERALHHAHRPILAIPGH